MKSRRWLQVAFAVPLFWLATFAGSSTSHAQETPGSAATLPRTVFFVRHAEKAQDDPRDPSLSEAGSARADLLARTLEKTGVTHLFATEYRRTKLTLEPLAEALGLEITVIGARDGSSQLEAVRVLPPGAVAVVAGHSNTVPAMVADLGGSLAELTDSSHGRVLAEDEYDRLIAVVLPPAGAPGLAPRALDLRYGD
jgi:phosphohistidine phosphatase SixA